MTLRLVGFEPGEIKMVRPTSAYDGMPVFVPLKSSGGLRVGMVPGKVVAAMGYSARVVCEDPPTDTWFHLDELRVPVQDLKP